MRREVASAEARWCSLRSNETDRGSSSDEDAAAAAEGEVNAEPGADADTTPAAGGGGERRKDSARPADDEDEDEYGGDRASNEVIVRACPWFRPGVEGCGRASDEANEGLSDEARTCRGEGIEGEDDEAAAAAPPEEDEEGVSSTERETRGGVESAILAR